MVDHGSEACQVIGFGIGVKPFEFCYMRSVVQQVNFVLLCLLWKGFQNPV